MSVSVEVEFEQVEAGRHPVPGLVAAVPREMLNARRDRLRPLDEHVTSQVVEPQAPRARREEVDHVGTDGERVVYAVAVGRQHLRVEGDVEQEIAGDRKADDVGAADDLIRSIPGIDALAAGVRRASVLDKKDEGRGLLENPGHKAQFHEIVVAQGLGKGHRKTRFDRLGCDR